MSRPIVRGALIATCTTLLAAGVLTGGPAQGAPAPAPLLKTADAVAGSYVVVLKSGTADDAAARARTAGASVDRTFTRVLNGYSARLTSAELAAVRADPAVQYVTPDSWVEQSGFVRKDVKNWGIDRVDQRRLPLDGDYYADESYNKDDGSSVDVYVVDTGIYNEGPSAFELEPGTDVIGTSDGRVDCNGHGTHVAGIIRSYSYGMTYGSGGGAHLYPVRVLDCAGRGTTADALAGLDWVAQQNHGRPAVVNLSLSKGVNQALNDGVQAVIDSGIPVVVSAGDKKGGGVDACTTSPGSVADALTVAASTSKDAAAGYANHGTCVDLYAPGDRITSLAPGPPSSTAWPSATYSGSSQAAAHVTGAVVLYLQRHPTYSPAQVSSWITSNSTVKMLSGVPAGTPNLLLFSLEPLPTPSGVSGTSDRLEVLQNLVRPTRIYSANKAYFLAHRAKDGWLCLYNAKTGKVVWTSGHSAVYTKMNVSYLATYNTYGQVNWQTAKQGDLISTLIVNGKGYLMIREQSGTVLWTSPH